MRTSMRSKRFILENCNMALRCGKKGREPVPPPFEAGHSKRICLAKHAASVTYTRTPG
jgi:hypothetical protein